MLPFDRAVEIAGSKAKLAGLIGVSAQAVSQWNPQRVPPEQCAAIELGTGGRVRCEALRPDIEWQRDTDGKPVAYVVPLTQVPPRTN